MDKGKDDKGVSVSCWGMVYLGAGGNGVQCIGLRIYSQETGNKGEGDFVKGFNCRAKESWIVPNNWTPVEVQSEGISLS